MAGTKKILSVFLAVIILIGMLPFSVFGAEIVESGSCGEKVTYTLDSDGVLTISGEGDMVDYDWQESPFYDRTDIKTAVIENGVTSIGDYVFEDCMGLTSIVIPDSVTSIGIGAFSGCTGLTSIEIPDSVTSIKELAFPGCSGLASIVIPGSVTVISVGTFNLCTGFTSITISDGVTTIQPFAFEECTGLMSIVIPNSVTSIEDCAFVLCISLKDVYYTGSEEDWNKKNIDDSHILNATIHYNYKPVCEHDYKTVTTAATCKAEGKTVYTCSECGDTYTETIAKKAHTPVTVPAVAATYEKTGLTEGTKCSVCGTVIKAQTVVPKLTAKFIENEKIKLDADKDVVAKSGITQAELKKSAPEAKILDLDGKELAANKAVGSGMTVVMPDGTKHTVIVPGDGDSDGKIAASDARLALRQSVGLDKNPDWFMKSCNVDGEKEVKASDARLILRAAVGLEKI